MAADLLVLVVFTLFSLFFPAALILISKLIRFRGNQNEVATLNFESSEISTGSRLSIMKEYFHYFSAFLAFEIVTAVLLIWVLIANVVTFDVSIGVLLFAVFGSVLEGLAILLASRGE
jgi:NADH:ubiquinone oxidoreductase subunit 3 (subunit A)